MPIHISASLIDDYLACNRRAYYRINRPDLSIQNDEMVIGDIVHKSIEKFWDDKERAITFADVELGMRLPNSITAKMFTNNCIETFFSNFKQYLSNDDFVEKKFRIPFGNDVYIVGKMDRISNNSVFDWKTARKPLSDISKSVQFILYNWAYKKLFNKSPAGVYYAALVTGDLVMYKYDAVVESVLIDELIPELVSAIRNKDYVPNGIFRKSCFRCSYSESCLKEIMEHVVDSTTPIKK